MNSLLFSTTEKLNHNDKKECPRYGTKSVLADKKLCDACRQEVLSVQPFEPCFPKPIAEKFIPKSCRTYYHGKYGFMVYNSTGEQVGIVSDFAYEYCELHFFPKYHSRYGKRLPIVYIGGDGFRWDPLLQSLKAHKECEIRIETRFISYYMGTIMGLMDIRPAIVQGAYAPPEKFTNIRVKMGKQEFYLDMNYNLVDASQAAVFSLEEAHKIIQEVEKALKDCDVTAVCTMEKPAYYFGMKVIHEKYGEGTIVKIDNRRKHITVAFADGEKMFCYPMCFEHNFLKKKS